MLQASFEDEAGYDAALLPYTSSQHGSTSV